MILFSDRLTQLDDLLDKMAESLQLDETRWERMKSSYDAIADWLKADEGYFKDVDFEVYPQGSVRIGTAIKPLKGEEFDLDTVVHVRDSDPSLLPLVLFNRLKNRIRENEIYKQKIELKNRCLRINYAGDFHMDILPGRQQFFYDANKLQIPDRALDWWVSSNPRGYADWFLANVNSVQEVLLERAYAQEEITRSTFMNKPLQRAVQLIKRYRDTYFENRDYATSSIVLTTIFGMYYNGESSIFDTIENTLERIHNHVKQYQFTRLEVRNPVNNEEDFTDKWKQEPMYYTAFREFTIHLYNGWQSLKTQGGLVNESRILKDLFGEDIYNRGIKKQAEIVETWRNKGSLAMDRKNGILTSIVATPTSQPVRANTFFGI